MFMQSIACTCCEVYPRTSVIVLVRRGFLTTRIIIEKCQDHAIDIGDPPIMPGLFVFGRLVYIMYART